MSEDVPVCSITDLGDSLRITIRNRPHWPTIVWAIGCILSGVPLALFICPVLTSGDGLAMLAILGMIGMVLGIVTIVALPVLVWQYSGQEEVILDSQELRLVRSTPPATRERTLTLAEIGSVRVMPAEHELGYKGRWLKPATLETFHIGRIGLEYQGSVVRFGSGLTTDEASEIVEAIVRFREGPESAGGPPDGPPGDPPNGQPGDPPNGPPDESGV